jgi:protein-S-isoprenylcysteine O-methyltransferase Ste14
MRVNRVRAKGWILVGIQGILLAFLLLAPPGHAWRVPTLLRAVGQVLRWGGLVGIAIGALRLGLAASVHPEPSQRSVLRTTGPYRLVRHPIYSGVLVFAVGIAAASGSLADIAALVALAALASFKARFEEALLAERFPGYRAYAEVTPRFVPGLRRKLTPAASGAR